MFALTSTTVMSSSNSSIVPQLPDPMTPMAFLPPDLAYQLAIVVYVFAGSLAVSSSRKSDLSFD